ncbi:hypothetical protein F2P56_032877 [Juglans regia]|uniref:NB-ARC domain-containing protein n=2 Tax=Juglans regia TaxID=51240 RepID=A0A833TZW5_JUGRE|nr:probable disease resistance protein At4g27220 [Juglans regia]KAF5447318.1 hypothetical protein F2P56_032877 [Juglans regia]
MDGLIDGNDNRNEIAWRISAELECKRYLLPMDEVWDCLDLHEIGIHDNQNDCNMVLTTRYHDICHYMETDEQIYVRQLSITYAYKMFLEKVGRNVNLPGIEPIAKLVVDECAALPHLRDMVARAFRNKDNIHLSNDGLKSLRKFPSIKIQEMDELIEFLKFCYEELDG